MCQRYNNGDVGDDCDDQTECVSAARAFLAAWDHGLSDDELAELSDVGALRRAYAHPYWLVDA